MNIKESVEKFFGENNVLVDFDLSQENESCYELESYIREREESDEDYEWVEDFADAIKEVAVENNLKRFRIDSDDDYEPAAADFFYARNYQDAYNFVSEYTGLGNTEIDEKLYEN